MAALTTNSLVRLSRRNIPVVGVFCMNKRYDSTVVRGQTSNLGAYRRGRGGRSSFSGMVVTVLGASGFVGKYIVNKLGKIGSQVIIPYRADPYYVKDMKLAGDLGQVLFQPYQLKDEDSLRKSMQYSNVVINLVGREHETKNFSFSDVNIDGQARIARIAREMGVEKLLHFSHLNAQPNPPEIYLKGGSKYLKSKFYGEQAVRSEFPDAIVFRPADIYGPEDRFLRYYASAWRRAHGRIPLYKKGETTIKMPVFVSDVSQGVVNALLDPEAIGKTFEIVGPHSYYLSDLVDYMYRILRWDNFRRTYVSPAFKLKVMYMSQFPNRPIVTMDKLAREHVSDLTHNLPTLEDLSVPLTRLEDRAPYELKMLRRYLHYEEHLGEFADPEPPPVIA